MIPKLTDKQIEGMNKHLADIEWHIGYYQKKLDTLQAEKALLEAMLETQTND